MTVAIPPPTDERWKAIVTGEKQPEFLGARVLVGRLSSAYKLSPTPATLAKASAELHELYSRLAHLPNIQAELARLFK